MRLWIVWDKFSFFLYFSSYFNIHYFFFHRLFPETYIILSIIHISSFVGKFILSKFSRSQHLFGNLLEIRASNKFIFAWNFFHVDKIIVKNNRLFLTAFWYPRFSYFCCCKFNSWLCNRKFRVEREEGIFLEHNPCLYTSVVLVSLCVFLINSSCAWNFFSSR